MKTHTLSILCASTLAIAAAASAAPAQTPEGSQRTYVRSFRLYRVDPRVAETWVWELCGTLRGESACRVVEVVEGDAPRIGVEGTDRVHAEIARTLADRDDVVRPARRFQLVLLAATRGKSDGQTIDPSLGEGARAALRDVADYLPFGAFRVLDTGFVTTTGRGELRLAGPEGLQYQVELAFRDNHSVDGPTIHVQQLLVRGEVVRTVELPPNPASKEGEPQQQHRARSVETLLNTTLSMRPGETAVVGTSRLDGGNEALVVLLTAIAP